MKAHVVYADWQAMVRYERAEVMAGTAVLFEQPEVYDLVYTAGVSTKLTAEQICDAVYALLNAEDGKARELSIRSMSVGDLIILEEEDKTGEVYACKPVGFENVSHLPHCGSWIEALCNG